MKLKVKLALFAFCLMGSTYILSLTNKNPSPDFRMENIEALARNEGGTPYYCLGIGSIDCSGNKVSRIIDNFR